MVSKLSEHGVAGFVLANGSMSTNTKGEGEIRQKLVENDLVDCMIALPGQLFYTTQIPVCLWFLSKDKSGGKNAAGATFSDRKGKTLFIDARKVGSMISRSRRRWHPLRNQDDRNEPGTLRPNGRILEAGRNHPRQPERTRIWPIKFGQKETPAPINREGLRKKCPGSTLHNRYNLSL
ncbi:N-6 DNA methylase [Coraliomargarita sp. SDUM461003]|uniref:N-6 DNA methylase n=1 Tax=Thalassobacterium maritimum TaxID=3041265 RepID=A0ABU1AZ29_9BACT|nr:N-6 DNA methylase [Coraliomargarita sp. SDUM461003]MDQ8209373.1 N-6 DNA methylase [Coraliomargarita sp. SDUM461003]